LLRIDRPVPIGIFVEGRVGLRSQADDAGHHLRHLRLAQPDRLRLLLHFQGAVAAHGDELADADKPEKKNGQRDHDFQKREAAPAPVGHDSNRVVCIVTRSESCPTVSEHHGFFPSRLLVVTTPVRPRMRISNGLAPRALRVMAAKSSRAEPSGRNVTTRDHEPLSPVFWLVACVTTLWSAALTFRVSPGSNFTPLGSVFLTTSSGWAGS